MTHPERPDMYNDIQSIAEKIKQRRAQILIHSHIYYILNDNIVSDEQWQHWAFELAALQNDYPRHCAVTFFDKAFRDWTGAHGGSHLPLNDRWVAYKANRILQYHRQTYLGGKR